MTFERGLARLARHYEVQCDSGVYARRGFLAGDDQRRLTELNHALSATDIQAILIARGGHGANRIVHQADFDPLREHPKWIVGFSDATVLHNECARLGVASIHGPNVTGLGVADDGQWQEYREHLAAPAAPRSYDGITVWHSGAARGRLFGGNLSLLHASLAAARLSPPRDCVLLLEEVSEAPYRIDRMLSALLVSGALSGVAGVVIGQLHDCNAGDYAVSAEDVLRERLSELRVPLVHAPFVGHGQPNTPLTLGLDAILDGSVTLRLGEPA